MLISGIWWRQRVTLIDKMKKYGLGPHRVGEPFSRSKVINGVRKACQGRPVSEDDLALLAQRVEEAVRATGAAELASRAHVVNMVPVVEEALRLDPPPKVIWMQLGARDEDLVPFEKYAAAAASLTRPASAARALQNGAAYIERADKLVQLVARQLGLRHPVIDRMVDLVDTRLHANREKAAGK